VLNAERPIVEIDITCRGRVAGSLPGSHRPRGAIAFGMARVKQDLYNQLHRAGIVELVEGPGFPDAAGGRGLLLGPPEWGLDPQ